MEPQGEKQERQAKAAAFREYELRRRKEIAARIVQGRLEMPERPTARAFARKWLGYSEVAYGEWEDGTVKVEIGRLEQIARHQRKPLSFYLGEDSPLAVVPRAPAELLGELGRYVYGYVPLYDALKGQPIDYVATRLRFNQVQGIRAYLIPSLASPPEIQEGDVLIVHTSLPPKGGQWVVYADGQYARLGKWPVNGVSKVGVVLQLLRDYGVQS